MSELEKDKELEEKVEVVEEGKTEDVPVEETKEEPVQPEAETEPQDAEPSKEETEEDKDKNVDEPANEEPDVEGEQEEGEQKDEPETTDEPENVEGVEIKGETEVDDKVKELLAEVEELRAEKEEGEALKSYADFANKVAEDLNVVASNVQQALKNAFKDNNIPTDVSMEELKKLDPAKATLAENFLRDADRIVTGRKQMAEQAVKNEFTKVVFKKAERLFKKYDISDAEAPAIAETFVNIMNTVGINDLQGDLASKVELAVARGKFVTPKAEPEKVDVVEDVPPAEDVPPVEVAVEESGKANEEGEQKEESEKVEVPADEPKVELDEFTEGIAGEIGAAKHASGDLLAQLAKIQDPRERVKFYKANEKEIMEASKHHYYNK